LVALAADAPNGAGAPPIPYVALVDARPVLSGLWLIKGVLPRRGTAVVYGPSGEGKTFVTLDLLMHVARGVDWRARKTTRIGVLYLTPDGGSVIANRLESYRRHYGVADADFVIVSAPIDLLGKVSEGDLGKIEELIAHVERTLGFEIGVIAVDTVSRAMPGGDENQPADMSRFVDNAGRLAGDKRLVVPVHHTPKSDGTVLRGHSSLHGAADCELNVVDKTIASRSNATAKTACNSASGSSSSRSATTKTEIRSSRASRCRATRPTPRKRISGAAKVALGLLQNAIIDAGETPPACNHIPPNIRAVRLELWRRYCDQGQVSNGDSDDAKRMAFRRAANKLREHGETGIWSGWAWLANKRT
jgi:hypothetical protein